MMKKFIITFGIGLIISAFLIIINKGSYLISFGLISLILGLILSGTIVSGDRMRANITEGEKANFSKKNYIYFVIFSIPFILFHWILGSF